MRTPLNLWLWRYREKRSVSQGLHLMADEAACKVLRAFMSDPGFVKMSFALPPVPPAMAGILQTKNPRYVPYARLRLYATRDQVEAFRYEENDGLDLYLNDHGFADIHEGLGYMLNGELDYRFGEISYWGLLSAEDYNKRYGAPG
jgi:hypothetical protein